MAVLHKSGNLSLRRQVLPLAWSHVIDRRKRVFNKLTCKALKQGTGTLSWNLPGHLSGKAQCFCDAVRNETAGTTAAIREIRVCSTRSR